MSQALAVRIMMEKLMLKKLLEIGIEHGFHAQICNGEDESEITQDIKELIKYSNQTDEERVYFGIMKDGEFQSKAWFYFVYGNSGWDVICDYTANQASEMLMEAGINELSEKLENGDFDIAVKLSNKSKTFSLNSK